MFILGKTCRPEDVTCLRIGAPVAEALEAVNEMWDKPFDDGQTEELPMEIDEAEDLASKIEDQENLAFSDDFYNKFCELKD